jgi:hypothetical protein
MSFDDSNEIERLRRELEEITAERDYLLAKNRRLTQTSQGNQARIWVGTNELVKEAVPSVTVTKQSDSKSSVNSESPLAEKIRLYRSLFHGVKMSTQYFGKTRPLLNRVTARYVKMNGPLACVRSSKSDVVPALTVN